jgi:hypothetical protein
MEKEDAWRHRLIYLIKPMLAAREAAYDIRIACCGYKGIRP